MKFLSFISKEEKIESLQDLEIAKGKIQLMIMKMAAGVLALIMLSVVLVMMVGLFMPNDIVDNNEIFKIIGPAFSTIVGAFVGAFATMMGMKTADFDPNVKVQEMGKSDYKAIAEADSIRVDNEIKMMKAVDEYLDSDEDHGPF